MNKFKTAILAALIGATAVGCGGAGGGGGVNDVANDVVGAGNQAVTDTAQVVTNTQPSSTASTATANVVSDSGVSPAQTYIPFGGGDNVYFTNTVLAMDLNKDGVNDVVKFRTEAYNNLYIEALINNGDGTSYTNETSKYFGKIGNNYGGAHDAHLADLNDDGLLDILTYSNCFDDGWNLGCLPPMIQQADGSFEVTSNPLLQTLTDGIYEPADIDGDGDMDIIHANLVPDFGGRWGGADQDRREWEVFENRSENGVAKFVHHYDVVKNTPAGVGDLYGAFVHFSKMVDINSDGKLDILTGGTRWDHDENGGGFLNDTAKMSVYLGNGDFTFTYSKNSWMGNEAEAITVYRAHNADFDGDGDIDFAVATTGWDAGTFDGEENFMLWNTNGKLFKDTGTNTTHNYMGFTHQSDIADVDNDGDMDIVWWDLGGKDVRSACGENGNTMRVLKNDGAGSFTGTTYCLTPYQRADGSYKSYWTIAIRMADMNGDGFVDIVTGEWGNYGEDRVVFNNGDGTFNFDIVTTVK